MKKIRFIGMLVIIALLSGCYGPKTEQQPVQANAVEVKNFAFSPATITVTAGTTVMWTNGDSTAHTVTIASGKGFDSGALNPGQTFSWTFNDTGTFEYGCSFHPSMKGKVIVT